MNWLKHFDERQQKEIRFSQKYAKHFNHGTDGHHAKLIVAKMAELLNHIEDVLLSEDNTDRPHSKRWQIEEILRVTGNMSSLSETENTE